MAWENLSVTKPHLVYLILGGFTSLFMLCSSVIKERMYIGEATVATIVGVVFGPHAANLINPLEWGSVDLVTLEFSRVVLVVQCFAVGVELPKFYMEKHWKSVVYLLIPVMTFGWLMTSVFIFWMVPPLNWLDGLVVAACVTATDPVLASAVVGKGKFSQRVPKHLRDLLSAESGCNDGMAFPFIYLALYLIQFDRDPAQVTYHWIVWIILYECIFGAIYGFIIGYVARHGIKYAEDRDLIDRESFLVFYFVVALFCAGSGSILGMDDLLVGFAAGVGFSNDGWFGEKTDESHVSNVIDLLLNLTYFVYLGTIIPWEQYNNWPMGLTAWRLCVIAIFVILFRRIPIMLALKPVIPDVKTWREALFAGHFGPIGVGAIYVAILARAELEHNNSIPLDELPGEDHPHYQLIYLVWPLVTFLVIASMIVHGSSVAVFTLGKHINTLTITMSYTQAPEDGPSWMNRLPRISSQSRSQARTMSDTDMDDTKMTEAPIGHSGLFLRRQKDDDSRPGSRASSLMTRRRKKKWDDGIGPGGPVSQSAIFPKPKRTGTDPGSPRSPLREDTSTTLVGELKEKDPEKYDDEITPESGPSPSRTPPKVEVYDEGDHIIIENQDGDVLAVEPSPRASPRASLERLPAPSVHRHDRQRSTSEPDRFDWSLDAFRRKMSNVYNAEVQKRKDKDRGERHQEPARAYQFGNTIIVEDEDGEVVRTYELPAQKPEEHASDLVQASLKMVGLGGFGKQPEKEPEEPESSEQGVRPPNWTNWPGFKSLGGEQVAERARRKSVMDQQLREDDKHIRFTIGGVGQRMNKEDFIKQVQQLDVKTRGEVLEGSSASHVVRTLASQDPPGRASASPRRSDLSPRAARSDSVSPMRRPSPARLAAPAAESSRSVTSRPRAATTTGVTSSSRGRTEQVRRESPMARGEKETPAEQRRRLALLEEQGDEIDPETGETPAERRRREGALGLREEEDSDDEDEGGGVGGSMGMRVPPAVARRGIRFAEPDRSGRS